MHSKLPWKTGDQNCHSGISILEADEYKIANVYLAFQTSSKKRGKEHFELPENAVSVGNAALIVKAVNHHQELVDVLRKLTVVEFDNDSEMMNAIIEGRELLAKVNS